jgi:hypothetical protein
MTAKVLSIDASKAKVSDLVDALKLTMAVVEDQLYALLTSCAICGAIGDYDPSTLDEKARPDFERLTVALLAARKAIKKAGTI